MSNQTKIILHTSGSRQYRSIARHLAKNHLDKASFIIENLHNQIFDICYIQQPEKILFPLSEYTQEIHNYIALNNQIQFYFYVDFDMNHQELVGFLNQTNSKYICQSKYKERFKNSLFFDYLYDDDIYHPLENIQKNSKVAVSLSQNNDLNKSILENIIYPNLTEYDIVLFNNPKFVHPQNIGIYNEPDLNYIMNIFSYFVDIDKMFLLESFINNIPTITDTNILDALKEQRFDSSFQGSCLEYKCSQFVANHLVSFLGI